MDTAYTTNNPRRVVLASNGQPNWLCRLAAKWGSIFDPMNIGRGKQYDGGTMRFHLSKRSHLRRAAKGKSHGNGRNYYRKPHSVFRNFGGFVRFNNALHRVEQVRGLNGKKFNAFVLASE